MELGELGRVKHVIVASYRHVFLAGVLQGY